MIKEFAVSWKKSKQVRKQRKYRANAPLHIRKDFMNAHLIKDLAKKYGRRSFPLRKGDTVKVHRGQLKGKEGKVDRVDVKKNRIFVAGIDVTKRDGTKSFPHINPSNVVIKVLELEDKRRIKQLKKGQREK